VACVNQHITHIYLKQFSQINCYLVNTPAEGLIALIKGNVDAFIYPEQIVLYLAQDLKLDDEIKVVGDPLRVLSWSMTVKKGNSEVLALLNAGINKVKESGEYQEIYDSWFGKQLFSGFSYQEVYLIVGAVVFPAILAVLTLGLLFYTHNMRRANKALIESQNNYRTLANNLPESVFLKDIHSVYIFCNKNFAESLGIEAKEIVGKTDFDLFPENAEQYRIGDKQVMQNKELIEFVESYKKEGSTGYINTIKTPVYNDDGELTGVLGIFWDITEQRQLQNKLSATIAEYNAITATVPDIMYKLDLDGNYLWWNKALENVTGLTAEQLKNSNARDIFVEQDRAQIGEAIQHVANDGYYEVGAKIIGRDKDIEYYFNGARLYDNNGEVIGLVGSGRDISKQKEAEEKHDKLYKQLLQSQKMEAIGQLT
ncbi:MAG: PAS domain-containing protein, partial [Gammaproteobacteria bacterium]|nr:PAS domain-containing protein [Gammaproteobacteria bacterium]